MNKDIIEQAYCFLHQKYRVYKFSESESQKDDIEYAICSFVNGMSRELYSLLSDGRPGFLKEHCSFGEDIAGAIEKLSAMMQNQSSCSR